MKTIGTLAFLLSGAGALGQAFSLSDPAFMAQVQYAGPSVSGPNLATNLPGIVWLGGWVADYAVTNNSGQATNVPQLVSGTLSLALTNATDSLSPHVNNLQNGHHTMLFDGSDDILRAAGFSYPTPMTFFFLARFNWADITERRIISSANQAAVIRRSATSGVIYGAALPGSWVMPTNSWCVYTIRYNGTTSQILTNNINEITGSGTANGTSVDSIGLGGRYSSSYRTPMEIPELWIATNAVDAAGCSNMFWYFTNKYAVNVNAP